MFIYYWKDEEVVFCLPLKNLSARRIDIAVALIAGLVFATTATAGFYFRFELKSGY